MAHESCFIFSLNIDLLKQFKPKLTSTKNNMYYFHVRYFQLNQKKVYSFIKYETVIMCAFKVLSNKIQAHIILCV